MSRTAANVASVGDVLAIRPGIDSGARWMVSTDGGSDPLWSHSGRELFYRDVAGNLVSVAITTSPTLAAGAHHTLFSVADYRTYAGHGESDIAPDDQRVVMVRRVRNAETGREVLVRNWVRELERAEARK